MRKKVVGIENRTIYQLGDSWVVTIPNDTMRAIFEVHGQRKSYPVKLEKLGNGDVVVRISELLSEVKEDE